MTGVCGDGGSVVTGRVSVLTGGGLRSRERVCGDGGLW